jgi:hypothetical protein
MGGSILSGAVSAAQSCLDFLTAVAARESTPQKHQGRIAGSLSALGFLGKQKDYWPNAAAEVPALAICLSVVCDGTVKRSVMPNSGSCMALT